MLFFHIFIAISSLVLTGYTYFFPSKIILKTSYATVALTLITGTYLILSLHTNMLQMCAEGLVYLGVVSVGIVAAQYKLHKLETK